MAPRSAFFTAVTNPAGGLENFVIPVDGPRARCFSMLPMDAPAGITQRQSYFMAGTPTMQVDSPAVAGGIPIYIFGRNWHSECDPPYSPYSGPGSETYRETWEIVPLNTEITIDHGLLREPDFVVVETWDSPPIQGIDYAVTLINDTQIKVRNWDLASAVKVRVACWLVYSKQIPRETIMIHPTITLAGAGVVPVPHGLGRAPDFVSVFPFEDGGVQPSGLPIMDSLPDADNIYLRNVAAGNLDVKVYAQATHSIQL